MTGISYTVAYTEPSNILYGVTSIDFIRDIQPVNDSFTVTVTQPANFPTTSFSSFSPANEILIYRNDNISNSLTFRGIITNIQYNVDTNNGLVITLTGYGYWYLLTTKILALGGWGIQPYPNTNPYIMSLNTLLNRSFDMIFNLILQIGMANQGGGGKLATIIPANPSGDFASTTTNMTGPVASGATSFTVASVETFQISQTIFVTEVAVDYTNPTSFQGDTNIITSLNSSTNTMDVLNPLSNSYVSGSFIFNYIVNDNMFLQYSTVSDALGRLVTSAIPNQLGEYHLDFTQPNPVLSIKLFDPAINAYGTGQNKSVTQSSNPQILFNEGEQIVDIEFSFDYTAMANSMVLTGQQFAGSQIFALAIQNTSSIATYGLKQLTTSLGNVVDVLEIGRYVNNILQLIQNPIPTATIDVINTYPNSAPINPGDLISINSPTLANIVPNMPVSDVFSVRIKTIERQWSTGETGTGGEYTTLTFMYPLIQAASWVSNYALPSLESQVGALSNTTDNALYANQSGVIEDLDISFNGIVADRFNYTTFPSQLTFSMNLSNLIVKQLNATASTLVATIYSLTLTVTTTRSDVTTVKVQILQPDGMLLYNEVVPIATKINLLSLINPTYTTSGILLSQVSGNYVIIISNVVGGTVNYTGTITCAYIRDPNSTSTIGGVNSTGFNYTLAIAAPYQSYFIGEGATTLSNSITTTLQNGTPQPIIFTSQNTPYGVTISFSPASVLPTGTVAFGVQVLSGFGGGYPATYVMQINGTANGKTKSANYQLTVRTIP